MSFVYFTDRDLGTRFPEILKSGGLTVERHTDHFAPDAPDEAWLEAVGKRGWIALTHDRRIRYKPNERDAVMRHGVALLVIVGAASFPDLAHAFVSTLPRVESFLARHKPPFIAKVYRPKRGRSFSWLDCRKSRTLVSAKMTFCPERDPLIQRKA